MEKTNVDFFSAQDNTEDAKPPVSSKAMNKALSLLSNPQALKKLLLTVGILSIAGLITFAYWIVKGIYLLITVVF